MYVFDQNPLFFFILGNFNHNFKFCKLALKSACLYVCVCVYVDLFDVLALIMEWMYTLKFLMVRMHKVGQIVVSTIYIFEENVIYFGIVYAVLLVALAAPFSTF